MYTYTNDSFIWQIINIYIFLNNLQSFNKVFVRLILIIVHIPITHTLLWKIVKKKLFIYKIYCAIK